MDLSRLPSLELSSSYGTIGSLEGLGFRVQGFGLLGLAGFGVYGYRAFRAWGLGLGSRVCRPCGLWPVELVELELRVEGLGLGHYFKAPHPRRWAAEPRHRFGKPACTEKHKIYERFFGKDLGPGQFCGLSNQELKVTLVNNLSPKLKPLNIVLNVLTKLSKKSSSCGPLPRLSQGCFQKPPVLGEAWL